MPKSIFRLVPALLGIAAFAAVAQEGPTLGPLRTFVSYEIGQIEGGTNNENRRMDRELISHAAVWTLQEATLNEHARVRFGIGGAYFFVLPRNLGANAYVHSKRSAFGLTEAHGEFDLLEHDGDDYLLRLKAGVFGYKYNPDAKNLGEYMFRTWTYPNIITTGGLEFINSAAAQLSGFALGTKKGGLTNDLILSVESDHAPIFGLNLTDIVSYDFGIFQVGAGFMFNNFYNPDEAQVTPKDDPRNAYYTLFDGREVSHDRYMYELANGLAPAAPVDTGYYTFAGQKVMLRASASLGKLLGGAVAPHELKVYGEAILLGLKNYPTYYTKMEDRLVYMAGVNLPAFGLLDLLSVEVEYAPNPFENSTEGPLGQKSAIPTVPDWGAHRAFDKDDVKWTVVARKDVYNGFSIYAQVANDHIRMLDQFSTPDFREFLQEKDDWYWAIRLAYAL
jgi:hypothetical protein